MILQGTSLKLATKKLPLQIRRNLKGKDRFPLPPFFRGELLVYSFFPISPISTWHRRNICSKQTSPIQLSEYCFTKAVIAEIAEHDQEDFLEERSFLGQRVLGGPTRQLDTSVITHICIYILMIDYDCVVPLYVYIYTRIFTLQTTNILLATSQSSQTLGHTRQ